MHVQAVSNELSDGEMVAAAREGDLRAFTDLVTRHLPMLRNVCRRYYATSQVDDVVQEAILQAMLSLESLRDGDRFGAWLCGIGLNIARRWQREPAWPAA